jgi:hypothetical protein
VSGSEAAWILALGPSDEEVEECTKDIGEDDDDDPDDFGVSLIRFLPHAVDQHYQPEEKCAQEA